MVDKINFSAEINRIARKSKLDDRLFIDRIKVGGYLEIDLDKVSEERSDYIFSRFSGIVKGVGHVDSSSSIFQIIWDTNEYLGEVAQVRQNQLVAAEYARWVNQTQSWTSYKMMKKNNKRVNLTLLF